MGPQHFLDRPQMFDGVTGIVPLAGAIDGAQARSRTSVNIMDSTPPYRFPLCTCSKRIPLKPRAG